MSMKREAFMTPNRPRHRVNKTQPRGDRAQPWTASRCQRLLRPLVSRIALLRRELLTSSTEYQLSPREGTLGKRPAESCAAWLVPRKKLRRTYSQKCSINPTAGEHSSTTVKFKAAKDLQRDSRTGEIVAFTPLLRRVRGHQASSPPQGSGTPDRDDQVPRKCDARLKIKLDEQLASLKRQVSPSRYNDYEAIFRNTEALLNATNHTTSNKGASSFMDMCLRKVPQYISGVESWEVHEAENNGCRSTTTAVEVAPKVYAELEYMGASDVGWSHLRTVVQTDGLDVITEAIAEGLFPDELSVILIELCAASRTKHLHTMLEIFLARQYAEPLSTDSKFSENSTLHPLSFLRYISAKIDRPSLLLQHLSALLIQGFLPAAWLATREFADIWAMAYRMLSKGKTALDAIDFLATSVVLLFRHQLHNKKQNQSEAPDEMFLACQHSYTTSLSLLSAMRRLSHEEVSAGNSPNLDRPARIGRALDFVFQVCLTEVESRKGVRENPGGILCLAMFLSTTALQCKRLNVPVEIAISMAHHVPKAPATRRAHDTIISLIANMAKLCGRGTSQPSRRYLAIFCRQLGRLKLQNEALDDINKAGAFSLAEQSNDLRDLIYAEKLVSGAVGPTEREARISRIRPLFEGYRWDETISEWITVSPLNQRRKPPNKRILKTSGDPLSKAGRTLETSGNRDYPPRATPTHSACSVTSSSRKAGAVDQHRTKETRNGNMSLSNDKGPNARPRDGIHQSRKGLPSKRQSCSAIVGLVAHYDELSDDKENRAQVMTRKRHSDGIRNPSAGKRRIRFSGIDAPSDDELGM